MSTNDTTDQKRSDSFPGYDAATVRNKSLIGVDGSGCEHYWDSYRQTVVVLDGEHIAHVEQLDARPLDHWVAFIEDVRGWDDLHFTPGGLPAMLAQIEVGD